MIRLLGYKIVNLIICHATSSVFNLFEDTDSFLPQIEIDGRKGIFQ